jgi:N-glycosylase/DNA lyase
MHIREALPVRSCSNQQIFDVCNGTIERLELPPPHTEILPGVKWGLAEMPFTPAFWASQVWFDQNNGTPENYTWSDSLKRGMVACLLGGHGITWEMNRAAFDRLISSGLIDSNRVEQSALEQQLLVPLMVRGRPTRYRFPRAKSSYIAEVVNRFAVKGPPPDDPLLLREWLLSFRGIGMKTASWITRNHLGCSRVAIIDIHIFRAGVLMHLFQGNEQLPRDYRRLEEKYLQFADAVPADARRLDIVIWRTMKQSNRLAAASLKQALLTRRSRGYNAALMKSAA